MKNKKPSQKLIIINLYLFLNNALDLILNLFLLLTNIPFLFTLLSIFFKCPNSLEQ